MTARDLPATSQVGNGIDSVKVLAKEQARDAKARRQRDVETAVSIKHGRVIAIHNQV